jgi:hypothetical protein
MMINNLTALHQAIAAVAPIDGVSADGHIWFQSSATDAQKTAAAGAVSSFVDSSSVSPKLPPLQALPRPKHITEL